MLKTRVITALIGLVIAIIAITAGGYIFNGIILLLALLGWREYVRILRNIKIVLPERWGYLFTLLMMGAITFGLYKWAIIAGAASVLVIGLLYIFGPARLDLSVISTSLLGFFYINGGFAAFMALRENSLYDLLPIGLANAHIGELVIWLLLLTTWASDTFAYFAGVKWGKRKIVPNISPNKSLEGYVGGFIGCLLTGIIYAVIVGIPFSLGLGAGLLTGIAAPLGDLFESKLKRACGVKDSGVLLPGHGGVLDRFDSLLFSAPMILVYLL